ncbi:hypothetical protein [Tenacibaculum sp. MAR_2009_124]|uniref:hypothetical protein n=1 Tax=Tenacibaculum sp. MAR_2009_124 TaxID=1250059 RepID=UPI000B850125|nr:hypothetical protein [Tenacibaculum sp. MAR_2009_124]
MGEEIWLKSYILEQNSQKLHTTTSNLYVSIFDQEGNLKDQKLFQVTNGMGIGNIKIDSTFTEEIYFLKASTNWMKNFHEDISYIQKIEIVSNRKKRSIKNFSQDKFYEFKLFPEGGHLLAETINNLGILIKDKSNNGIAINKGVVKNKKGDIIKEFKTNRFGLGDINLLVNENEIYSFEATLENGIVISQETSIPNKQGITMRVVNSNPDNLFIKVRTNKKSTISLSSKTYTIFIHNTREYQKHEFTFNKKDTVYSLIINKNRLAKGVNTITVFNESFKPVLERIIYNHKEELYSDISIHKISSSIDSLVFQIKNISDQKLYLSSSFLPSQTKAYNSTNSIYNSFLFAPYIKGNIQNIDYYLKNINHKKLRDLDLLLLTQGWSKYSWNNIFNHPPNTNYQFENGITIKGKLNKPLKKDEQLLIFSDENDIIEMITPVEGNFKLSNTFIKENSLIKFGISKKGTNIKKVSPSLQFSKRTSFEKLPQNFNHSTKPINELNYEIKNLKSTFRETEILDEVVVKKKRDIDEASFKKITIPVRKMTDLDLNSDKNVFEFLRKKYVVVNTSQGYSIRSTRATETRSGVVNLFLNNRLVEPQFLWMFNDISLKSIKAIYFGETLGLNPVEQIHIFTLTSDEHRGRNNKLKESKIKKGFSKTKEYYSPEFYTYSGDTFRHFGSVFWIPDISIAPNSIETFKIPTKLQNDIKMHLEGVSESGGLISKKIVLN